MSVIPALWVIAPPVTETVPVTGERSPESMEIRLLQLNVAVLDPAGTVTVAGNCSRVPAMEDWTVSISPPAGATPSSVTVAVAFARRFS